jgi:hypothetical protein
MVNNNVNLLDHWGPDGGDEPHQPLEIVRLDANQTAVVLFTDNATSVKLHYCDETEVHGYIRCNGESCVLCQAGKSADERVLLPVLVLATQRIGVLPISPASRPGSLRPQIMPALNADKRVALLISKPDRMSYRVTTAELAADMDDGAAVIKEFVERHEAGKVDLAAVYVQMDNRDMEALPGIAMMLKLRGRQRPCP